MQIQSDCTCGKLAYEPSKEIAEFFDSLSEKSKGPMEASLIDILHKLTRMMNVSFEHYGIEGLIATLNLTDNLAETVIKAAQGRKGKLSKSRVRRHRLKQAGDDMPEQDIDAFIKGLDLHGI